MVSGTKPGTERRAHARVVHSARAVLSTKHGEFVGDVLDVSVGGLGVTVDANIQPGEFVRVRLPLQPDADAQWIDPDAVVVRVANGSGSTTLGLSFHALADATQEQLAQHVEFALSDQAPLPETPTQRFTAKTRGDDPEAARQALRDAVAGPAAPSRSSAGSPFSGWLARIFGRRGRADDAPAASSGSKPQSSPQSGSKPNPAPIVGPRARKPTRDDLKGLIRASLEDVAEARQQEKSKKRS